MSLFQQIATSALLLGNTLANPVPQGPNTVYQNNPTLRTQAQNGTWTLIPLDFDVVSRLVAPKKLVPIAPNSKYYSNFPAGKHPIVVNGAFNSYISMAGLAIPEFLMGSNIRVPCVDELEDGKTCFNQAIIDYVGGANGQLLPGTVPALVGSLEGTFILPGMFDPDSSAVKDIGGGEATFQVNAQYVPNPVSGPGLAPPAISFTVHHADPTYITEAGFHYFINQPLILTDGMCQRNAIYFNETFARPFFTAGTVQLNDFPVGLSGVPTELEGTYTNGTGYSAQAEIVGYNPQTCGDAAAQNDPMLYD